MTLQRITIIENKDLDKLSQPGNRETMRTITLEEHYASPAFWNGPGRKLKEMAKKESSSALGGLLKNCPISGIKELL